MKKTNFGKNSRGAEAPLAPLAPPSMLIVATETFANQFPTFLEPDVL